MSENTDAQTKTRWKEAVIFLLILTVLATSICLAWFMYIYNKLEAEVALFRTYCAGSESAYDADIYK